MEWPGVVTVAAPGSFRRCSPSPGERVVRVGDGLHDGRLCRDRNRLCAWPRALHTVAVGRELGRPTLVDPADSTASWRDRRHAQRRVVPSPARLRRGRFVRSRGDDAGGTRARQALDDPAVPRTVLSRPGGAQRRIVHVSDRLHRRRRRRSGRVRGAVGRFALDQSDDPRRWLPQRRVVHVRDGMSGRWGRVWQRLSRSRVLDRERLVEPSDAHDRWCVLR
jgi:hypothetical protein